MNKQIQIGTILQYIQIALNIIIGIIYTPIMIRFLGQSEYGLYNIASSIIAYLSLLSLGFGSSYIRYYTFKKKNNPDKIPSLNGLYLFTFAIIGVIALISGVILSLNVGIFLNSSYSIKDFDVAKWLMVLLAINLSISFPMSIFTSYITSQERFVYLKIANMGKTLLSPALSIVALFFGYGSIGLVLVITVVNLLVDIVNIIFCRKKLGMKISFKKMEFSLLKEIFAFSSFIAINQLIDQINWQTDKIIIGKMLNGENVSVYSVGASLNTYYISFSTAISSLFVPRINRMVAENPPDLDDKLTNLMIRVGRVQFYVLMLILLGFIFFGRPFISWWVGSDYNDSYYVALLLMAPVTIPLIQNIGIEIQRAKKKHQFRSLVYLIMALINVGITIVLCKSYGVIGAALGTTISLLLANGIIMNIYYHKKLGINIKKFWLSIAKTIPAFLVPLAFGLLIVFSNQEYTLTNLIKNIIFFTIIYLTSIFCLGLNKKEKNILVDKTFKRGNKK